MINIPLQWIPSQCWAFHSHTTFFSYSRLPIQRCYSRGIGVEFPITKISLPPAESGRVSRSQCGWCSGSSAMLTNRLDEPLLPTNTIQRRSIWWCDYAVHYHAIIVVRYWLSVPMVSHFTRQVTALLTHLRSPSNDSSLQRTACMYCLLPAFVWAGFKLS